MKTALKLIPTASPERANLAAAIAEAAPKRAEVDKARAKAEAARGALASALAAGPAAEREAEACKARLIDDPSADRSEMRAKRQAVADAADDLAIAREISARAETVLSDAEGSARYAAEKVEAAADAVIVASFEPALEAAERAGKEFARLAYAAGVIASAGNGFNGERTRMVNSVDALNPGLALRRDFDVIAAVQQAGQAPWREARTRLLVNADAPLPEIG